MFKVIVFEDKFLCYEKTFTYKSDLKKYETVLMGLEVPYFVLNNANDEEV